MLLTLVTGSAAFIQIGIFNNNIRAHVVNKTAPGFNYCLKKRGVWVRVLEVVLVACLRLTASDGSLYNQCTHTVGSILKLEVNFS